MIVDLSTTLIHRFALIGAVLHLAVFAPIDTVRASLPSAPGEQADVGMVAAGENLGAQAGREILRMGGNAVDAAVATAFAISVTDIGNSGLGGGGSMMIWLAGPKRAEFVEFYSRAGSARGSSGPAATAGIPGNAAGLLEAHARYGRLPREEILAPAIGLARDGFPVSAALRSSLTANRSKIEANAPADLYNVLFPGGAAVSMGTVLRQLEKAAVLQRISDAGADGFYLGPVAEEVVSDLNAGGNPATLEDFATFQPRWFRPLVGGFRQYAVLGAPPPMGGSQVVQALVLLDQLPLQELGAPADSVHAAANIIDAFRVARRDYFNYVVDPMSPVPAAGLVSPGFAQKRLPWVGADPIPLNMPGENPWPYDEQPDPRFAHLEPWGPFVPPGMTPMGAMSAGDGEPLEFDPVEEQTTHVSVVDADRNAVAVTMTLGPSFGAGFASQGIFFNTALSRFSSSTPIGNRWAPGRTPRSDTSPTIVLANDEVRLVTGARGGSRIPGAVVFNILHALEYGLTMPEAMAAERAFPFRASPELQIETAFSPETVADLEARGWEVTTYSPENSYFAGAYSILVEPDGTLHGARDRRRQSGGLAGHSDAPPPAWSLWAASFGLEGEMANPLEAPAGDGFSNLKKFAFGFSPVKPAAAMARFTPEGGAVTLRWNRSIHVGVDYVIEHRGSLTEGGWNPVGGAEPAVTRVPDVPVPAGYMRMEWTTPSDAERGFYRVRATVADSLLP